MTIDVHKLDNHLHLILLKTNDHQAVKNEGSERIIQSDRYLEYISSQNSHLILDKVNLLEFEHINSNQLCDKIFKLLFLRNKCDYCSIILTSRQTIEAIEAALKQIVSTDEDLIKNLNCNFQGKLRVYCVGNATEARFNNLISKYSEKSLTRSFFEQDNFEIRVANKSNLNDSNEHKQNGLELSKLIIHDYKELSNSNSKDQYRVFYPCSSIRKDDLSNELSRANIPFDELHVYRTTHSLSGLENLQTLINTDLNKFHERLICIVYFSPSCVDAVFNDCQSGRAIAENENRIYNISIGPSTSSMLNKYVDLVFELSEPSPQSLYKKMKEIFKITSS